MVEGSAQTPRSGQANKKLTKRQHSEQLDAVREENSAPPRNTCQTSATNATNNLQVSRDQSPRAVWPPADHTGRRARDHRTTRAAKDGHGLADPEKRSALHHGLGCLEPPRLGDTRLNKNEQ